MMVQHIILLHLLAKIFNGKTIQERQMAPPKITSLKITLHHIYNK